MRRYEALWLDGHGNVEDLNRKCPAAPVIEDAFAAFCQGTLIATEHGSIAVEDILPGMRVATADHGFQTLLWRGATTLSAAPNSSEEGPRLIRVVGDAFGPDRPMPDLMLGPRARLLYRDQRCRDMLGTDAAFAPARAFTDGMNVISVVPASAIRVYHLAFAGQRTLFANGIRVESYHPGPHAHTLMPAEMVAPFLDLFPHIDGFDEFGAMPVPRLTAFELESLRAA